MTSCIKLTHLEHTLICLGASSHRALNHQLDFAMFLECTIAWGMFWEQCGDRNMHWGWVMKVVWFSVPSMSRGGWLSGLVCFVTSSWNEIVKSMGFSLAFHSHLIDWLVYIYNLGGGSNSKHVMQLMGFQYTLLTKLKKKIHLMQWCMNKMYWFSSQIYPSQLGFVGQFSVRSTKHILWELWC